MCVIQPRCKPPQAKSCDDDSSTETLSDGAVVGTLEKAARSTSDAMSGLEDALKRALGSSSSIDTKVREELMAALLNEVRQWATGCRWQMASGNDFYGRPFLSNRKVIWSVLIGRYMVLGSIVTLSLIHI